MSEILSPALLAEIREAIANGQIPEISGIAQQAAEEAVSSVRSTGTVTGNMYTGGGLAVPINIPAITPEPDVGPGFYET